MQVGQILRTRTAGANDNGSWKAFDKPGGVAVTAFKQGLTIGTFAAEEKIGVYGFRTTFYKIRLLEAVTYNGKSYQYVYMEESKVFAYTAESKTYKAANTVNVRTTPNAANLRNKIGSVAKGAVAGTSDGTERNGFLYVKLTSPMSGYTYGFIAKTYLTAVASSTTTPSTTPSTGGTPATPTSEAPTTEEQPTTTTDKVTGLGERYLGEKGMRVARYALLGGLALLVGYVVWKVFKKD
jgi:hypothetical protein